MTLFDKLIETIDDLPTDAGTESTVRAVLDRLLAETDSLRTRDEVRRILAEADA